LTLVNKDYQNSRCATEDILLFNCL